MESFLVAVKNLSSSFHLQNGGSSVEIAHPKMEAAKTIPSYHRVQHF
jgi:hypothetical protein